MNNYPEDNICIFTTFMFRKTLLKFNWTEIVPNITLMWFNKSVVTINTTLYILDITSLRSFIYIYIYIIGFRICALNPNLYFPIM